MILVWAAGWLERRFDRSLPGQAMIIFVFLHFGEKGLQYVITLYVTAGMLFPAPEGITASVN